MTQSYVEFETIAVQFQKEVQQVLVNHEEFKDTDIAEIRVGSLISLRTVGAETSFDGMAKQFGAARVPLSALEKMAKLVVQFNKEMVTISIKDGEAKVERTVLRHPDISLGEQYSAPASIPVNATPLDILAATEDMPDVDISASGLKGRLLDALRERDAAVDAAFGSLEQFGVEKSEVQELVDRHIQAMARAAKKAQEGRRGLHKV